MIHNYINIAIIIKIIYIKLYNLVLNLATFMNLRW
jgi:hypothetical protein